MTWKRWIATSGLVACLATMGSVLPAQEGEEPAETPPAPEPKTETKAEPPKSETEKPSFWGDHNALYLEAAYGSGSSEEVESSIQTSATAFAQSKVKLDDVTNGSVGIGWKLPADRGSFLLSFTGYREDSYTMDSTGYKKAVINFNAPGQPTVASPDAYSWWLVQVDNGNAAAQLAPPIWTDTPKLETRCGNGAPGICTNGIVEPDEVAPGTAIGAPYVTGVPDNVQNRLQTFDGLFQREFGGRTWGGGWSAGLRYLAYEGNVPATAWLAITPDEFGFTNGAGLSLLSFHQDTTGIGPCGSLGLQYRLFRQRLTLYGTIRFAFMLQDLHVDSGNFFTLVVDSPNQFTSAARLEKSLSKSSWNFGGDLGLRVRILDGLAVTLAFNRTSYQDVVMLPFSITIPANATEVGEGTVGLFGTKDLQYDTLRLGMSFQF